MGFKMSPSPKYFNKPILSKSDLNVVAYVAKARIMCKITKGSVLQIRFTQNWLVKTFWTCAHLKAHKRKNI